MHSIINEIIFISQLNSVKIAKLKLSPANEIRGNVQIVQTVVSDMKIAPIMDKIE